MCKAPKNSFHCSVYNLNKSKIISQSKLPVQPQDLILKDSTLHVVSQTTASYRAES